MFIDSIVTLLWLIERIQSCTWEIGWLRQVKLTQSQTTQQETEYVVDSDMKFTFLWNIYVWITKSTEAYDSTCNTENMGKFSVSKWLFKGF